MFGIGESKSPKALEREKREREQRERIEDLLERYDDLSESYADIKCKCPHYVLVMGHFIIIDGNTLEYEREAEEKLLRIISELESDIVVQEKTVAERKAQLIAEREMYKDQYRELWSRIHAVGGKMKLKKKKVLVLLPCRRKNDTKSLILWYNEYDYVYLCTKLQAVEQIHNERKKALNATSTS